MIRKQALLMKISISSTIFLSALSLNTLSVLAENHDNSKKEQVIDLEINDVNAVTVLKEKLLKNDLFYQLTQSNLNSVKFDAKNSEIRVENLDLSKPGIQEVIVHMNVNYNNDIGSAITSKSINAKVKINFIDTTAPVISLRYNRIKLDYQEAFDPHEWIESVADNSIEPITQIQIAHDVDSAVSKDYKVNYTATDASGNTGSAVLNVTVKEKPKSKMRTASASFNNSNSISTMLNLINAARAERGLDALSLGSSDAQSAVAVRASEAEGYVSHRRPNGSHYKTAFDDYGVSYSNPLEILTYSGSSVQDKFDWWMDSTGHRNIILSSSSTKIAIGYSGKMWAAIAYK